MANSSDQLRAGFTGTPKPKASGIAGKAQRAAAAVKGEADALTLGARTHPETATTLLLAVGAFAFLAGYAFGSGARPETRRSYW